MNAEKFDRAKANKSLKKIKNSFWAFFINKRPVAWLAIFAMIGLGLQSMLTLPRETQPEITIPIATISTALPGANPSDTESLITKEIEAAVTGLSGIDSLTSVSGPGSSSIAVEFDQSIDLDKAVEDLKDRVDQVKSDLPDDATDPLVIQVDATDVPIITYSVIADRPIQELTKIAEEIQDELETINGVARVDLLGGKDEKINVEVNQEQADEYGLTLTDVSNFIKGSDFNVPIGIISSDKINYSVRIDNRPATFEEIQNLPLFSVNNGDTTTIIYLDDIAKISPGVSETSSITKLSVGGEKSLETVSLRIYKEKNKNSLTIVDESKLKVAELEETLDDDIEIAVSNDNSIFIRRDLNTLTRNGIQTTFIIIVVLFLALGFREGIISGLSIPLTFMITFFVMDLAGMTINGLTLFSLVIALGLMVDTAIVIMEGIHDNILNGYSSKEAALLSLETYKWPLIAGTFTTISAFVPMLLVSGIVGEFLKALPITISAALFSSLFVSLFIVPSVTTKFMNAEKLKDKKSILEPIFKYLSDKFEHIINRIVHSRKSRVLIILTSLFLFVASMALPITGALKSELFPVTDIDYFIVNVEAPKGLVLDETEKIIEKVEEELYQLDDVENFLTIIGSSQGQVQTDFVEIGGTNESYLANITVNLKALQDRQYKSYEIAEILRGKFANFTDAKVTIQELSEGPPTESPINVRITGEKITELQRIANDVKKVIEEIPGTQNVSSSFESGLSEFKFSLDRSKLQIHQVSGIQAAGAIRDAIQGIKSTTISVDEEDTDIIVKYDLPKINDKTNLTITQIENFKITTPQGYRVSLGELGDYEFQESLSSIEREDQKRIIKVSSDLGKDVSPLEVTTQIQAALEGYETQPGHEISFGGDTEEIQESFADLYRSMFVAVILIAFTLVLMFNSFKQPFIILITLPLALIGVFPGLMLIGLKLSFPAFLGVVALSGIVVNDAIVLIDKININRRNGMPIEESISEAAASRLQPIIMTSITTIAGILPLALTDEFWSGLGFSLIFGLAIATVLTLVVIPALYFMFEIRAERKRLKRLAGMQ